MEREKLQVQLTNNGGVHEKVPAEETKGRSSDNNQTHSDDVGEQSQQNHIKVLMGNEKDPLFLHRGKTGKAHTERTILVNRSAAGHRRSGSRVSAPNVETIDLTAKGEDGSTLDTISSPTDYGVPSAVDNEGGGTLNTGTRPSSDGVPSAVDSEGGGTLNTVTRPTDDGVPSAVDSEGGGTLNTVTSPTDAASAPNVETIDLTAKGEDGSTLDTISSPTDYGVPSAVDNEGGGTLNTGTRPSSDGVPSAVDSEGGGTLNTVTRPTDDGVPSAVDSEGGGTLNTVTSPTDAASAPNVETIDLTAKGEDGSTLDTISSPTDYGVPSAVDNEGGGTLNTGTRPSSDGVPSAVDSEGGGTLNTVTRPTDDGVPSAVDSEGGGTLNTVTSPTDAASAPNVETIDLTAKGEDGSTLDTISSPTDYGVPSAVDNEGGGTLNTGTRPSSDGVPSAVDSEGGGTLNTVTRPTDDGVPSAVDSEGGGTLNTVTSPTDAASESNVEIVDLTAKDEDGSTWDNVSSPTDDGVPSAVDNKCGGTSSTVTRPTNDGVPSAVDSEGGGTLSTVTRLINASSEKYKAEDCPYYEEMQTTFTKVFGLSRFHTHQKQAILAALAGKDCFILMPTGGGKSLCYQLTALVTPGVTVVVSPLRSLILDQVHNLKSLEVPAAHLSSDQSTAVEADIYIDLHRRSPEIKLLYVTPEKLSASQKLVSVLERLYERQLLARFVIDEAHCISQWGHDFRKDYMKLNSLREKYPEVPIMSLTATATPRVQRDVQDHLRLRTPDMFIQSFNRSNLQYSVRPKSMKVLEEIATMIDKDYRNCSGIVYCLSRLDCEKVAEYLQSRQISSKPYHAGLRDEERARAHKMWLHGTFKVVCATIAFGMGIDKPDVRFVVHHSIPKSVEGYFQESGRAGRDGKKAACILYYRYSDMKRIRWMIESDRESSPETRKVHMDNLYRVVRYCENIADCRRAQLLQHFGETFDSKDCVANESTVCDNCESSDGCITRDCTAVSKLIVKGIKDVVDGGVVTRKSSLENKLTMNQFIDIFMGYEKSKFKNECALYKAAQSGAVKFSRNDAERLFHSLFLRDIVQEELVSGLHDSLLGYLKLGVKAVDVQNGKMTIEVTFSTKRKGVPVKGKRGEIDLLQESEKLKNLRQQCHSQLDEKRREIARKNDLLSPEYILTSLTIVHLASYMPSNREEMLNIDGVTENKFEEFGDDFLEITREFAKKVHELKASEKSAMTSLGEISSSQSSNDIGAVARNRNIARDGKSKSTGPGMLSPPQPKRARKQ